MIAFNQIPINIRTPGSYVEFDNTRAVQGLPQEWHRILVVGQRLPAGSVAAAVPTRILSAAQAEENFGRGSMLAAMLAALKAANTYTEVWAVALDDNGAGVQASGTITVSGAPTESGTLNVMIGAQQVQLLVLSGASAASVATGLSAAINADTSLPVTAAVVGPVVTLTARHKGEVGNSLDVRLNYFDGQRTPKGLAVVVVPMGSGTANPDLQTAIAAIGDEQFQSIASAYTDASNLAKLEALLANRWGPMVQKEGHGFVAAAGSHATISTLGGTRNSAFVTLLPGGKSPTPTYVLAALAAAVDGFESDPARPRQTLVLPGMLPPAIADRYTREERNLHLYTGVSSLVANAAGQVQIERLITTYRTNALGVADISYLDIETLRTLAYLRFSVRTRVGLRFPRHKLGDDGTRYGPGQPIVTPSLIKDELVVLFAEWELAGLAEGMAQFKRDLVVQRNASDPNRVDAIIPPDVINQFRVFAGQVQFRL